MSANGGPMSITDICYILGPKSLLHTQLASVNEVSASGAEVLLHLRGTASSPLDTSFAMHSGLKVSSACKQLQIKPQKWRHWRDG